MSKEKKNIYLVRHGITAVPELEQRPETPLSITGEEQAKKLANSAWLANTPIDIIYSSRLTRAMETADIISKKIKKNVFRNEKLNEIDIHHFANQKEFEEYSTKKLKVLEQLVLEGESNDILVACHGNIIRAFLYAILKIDLSRTHSLAIDHTSVTHLEYAEGKFRILGINNTSHLL